MEEPSWSPNSLTVDWPGTSTQDPMALMQPSACDWQTTAPPHPGRDILDPASWLSAPSGSIDMGLSPVLSHVSQNSHSLNSFSDPEMFVPSTGLDLSSFVAEAEWTPSDHVEMTDNSVPGYTSNGPRVLPYPPEGMPSAPMPTQQPPEFQFAQFFPNGGQALQPKPPAHQTPPKALLPRTPESSMIEPAAQDQPRIRKSYAQGYARAQASTSSVSNRSHRPQDAVPRAIAPAPRSIRPNTANPGPEASNTVSRQGQSTHGAPRTNGRVEPLAPQAPQPSTSDFDALFQFHNEEHGFMSALSTLEQTYVVSREYTVHGLDERHASGVLVPANLESGTMTTDSASGSRVIGQRQGRQQSRATAGTDRDTTPDREEGRFRNHPFYNAVQSEDGLYHCPFENSESACAHEPTKLKCNYDKYIDSHVKPFQCHKTDECTKEKFSSTACLLRHEREKHGMHGHGVNPNLCWYPGCERAAEGRGFPRRYNMFDHMKRVHKFIPPLEGIPEESKKLGKRGGGEGSGGRRKRKSSVSSPPAAAAQPEMQRPRMLAPPPPPPPATRPQLQSQSQQRVGTGVGSELRMRPRQRSIQSTTTYPPLKPRQSSHEERQRDLYTQLTTQKDLLLKEIDDVRGARDKTKVESLRRTAEELRRLSEEMLRD